MKNRLYFIIMLLISMFLLTSCMMFQDNQPPEFYEKPSIEGFQSSKGVITKLYKANDEIIINFKVRDNQAINYVQVFKSTDLTKPIRTLVNNYGKNDYEAEGIRLNLPYDDSSYRIFIVVADTSGNKTSQILEGISFNVSDDQKPKIFSYEEMISDKGKNESDLYQKINDENLYKMKFYFKEVGSGIKNFIINGFTINSKYDKDPNIVLTSKNGYYVVEEDDGITQSGYLVFFDNVSVGGEIFKVSVSDNVNNKSENKSYLVPNKSPNPESEITLDLDYKRYYVIDDITGKTDNIILGIKAEDEISLIKKIEIFINGDKREIKLQRPLEKYSYEFKEIGQKSSEQTINVRVVAYNTVENKIEKNIEIKVGKKKDPVLSLTPKSIYKNGIEEEWNKYTVNDNIFIEDGDKVLFDVSAESFLGAEIKSLELFARKDFINTTLFKKEFSRTEEIVSYKEIVETEFLEKGVYEIYLKVETFEDGINNTVKLKQNIVYSDELYTASNLKLNVNFFYNSKEISQDIYYKTVSAKKTFKISKNTNLSVISEINSKFQNIQNVTYIINGQDFEADRYDAKKNIWQTKERYKALNIGEYELKIKITDTFDKAYILEDIYYIKVVETVEEAYGSRLKLFPDNYEPGIGDPININYEIDDDFGIDTFKVEVFERITPDSSKSISSNPFIDKKLDESKLEKNSKEWISYRTTDYVFKLSTINILGIKTELEADKVSIKNLHLEVIEPSIENITVRRSQDFINFKVDTSGGANLTVFAKKIKDGSQELKLRDELRENKDNTFTRYEFPIFLNAITEDKKLIFDEPGDYEIIFRSKYGDYDKQVKKILTIRDDSEIIFEKPSLKVITDIETPSELKFETFFREGYREDKEYENTEYFIPINYDISNKTNIDISFNLIDYNKPEKVDVYINDKIVSEIINPEDINPSTEYEGKNVFSYKSNISKEDFNIGTNNVKIYVKKPIYDESKNIYEFNLNTLDFKKPELNDYEFEISNIRIKKDEVSQKYFTIGNHVLNFINIDMQDNHYIGGFDIELYQRNSENSYTFKKSLYNGMKETIENKSIINIENIRSVFGSTGLNISNFDFKEGIGHYKLDIISYDKSYILGLKAKTNSIVRDFINFYNKTEDPIYIYLTENAKAKRLSINNDTNIINDNEFKASLEIEMSEGLDVTNIINKDSIQLKLEGPKIIQPSIVVDYYGNNKYIIIAKINDSIIDGDYTARLNFKTKYSDKLEEISQKILIDADGTRTIGKIERVFKNGYGRASFDVNINTNNSENLIWDVDDYYFEYNLKGSSDKKKESGFLIPYENKASLDLDYLKDGEYEIKYYLKDKAENLIQSQITSFIIEKNLPVLEDLIIDENDRNRNVLAYNDLSDDFSNSILSIYDDNKLYKTVFYLLNESYVFTDSKKYHSFNLGNILLELNDTTSYSDGKKVTLKIDSTDMNSNFILKEVDIYKDNTAPNNISKKNIPDIITNTDKIVDLFVKDNVATEKVEITFIDKELKEKYKGFMEKLSNDFLIQDWTYTLPDLGIVEGEYTLKVKATDLAGNISQLTLPDKVKIDNKKPVVKFEIKDLNPIDNNRYYLNDSTKKILSWEVEDFTIDANQGTVEIGFNTSKKSVVGDEKNIALKSLDDIGISSDGVYDIYLKAVDEADLQIITGSYTIVLDTNPPIINSVISDSTPLNENEEVALGEDIVEVNVNFSENNYSSVLITYNGIQKIGTVDYNETAGTGNISIKNLDLLSTSKDLEIKIKDKSGNEITKTYKIKK